MNGNYINEAKMLAEHLATIVFAYRRSDLFPILQEINRFLKLDMMPHYLDLNYAENIIELYEDREEAW